MSENIGVYHVPVMLAEVERYLINDDNGTYVDCTLGGAGHSSYLLGKYPRIKIIGIDCDDNGINFAKARLSVYNSRATVIRGNFRDIKNFMQSAGFSKVSGILADLGVSSRQLDNAQRGFSFISPNLDMRMDCSCSQQAYHIVNSMERDALADLFYQYGEERFSRRIAERIVNSRAIKPIETAKELAGIVASSRPRTGKIHPATKVFQALRIAVNGELDNLKILLTDMPDALNIGGRAVILTYHSLEDRMVKTDFRRKSAENVYKLLNKKVVTAGVEELRANPRGRSAKLRAVERLN